MAEEVFSQSSTDERGDARLTENAVRARAGEAGYPTTHAQFQSYIDAGLISEHAPGQWPVSTVDQVVRVRALHAELRSLPRRVIVLRGELAFRDIPPQKLRQALIDVIPTITKSAWKFRRVERALAYWLTQTGPLLADSRAAMRAWKLPAASTWRAILEDPHIEIDLFAQRCGAQYYVADAVLPTYTRGTRYDLAAEPAIPFEEQIVLLTVRDLAIFLEQRTRAEAASPDPVLADDDNRFSVAPNTWVTREYWSAAIERAGVALRAALPQHAKYYAEDGFDRLRGREQPIRAQVHVETMEFLRLNPHLERGNVRGATVTL